MDTFFLITFLLPVGIHFSLATAEVRETESYDVVYSYSDDIHFAALSLPALPDGELSSVQTLPVHIARIQRVLSHEYVVALRQALLSFSDSLIVRNYAKITNGLFARIIGKISALTVLQYANFINNKPGRIKYALN